MKFSLPGIKVPHHKNTSGKAPVSITLPSVVTIPMQMHIGKPALPCVKAEDTVFVGTLIANAAEGLSSPIHSSVSGVVKKIEQITLSSGNVCDAIVIESDGKQQIDPQIKPPVIDSKEALIDAIKQSGIVGLGGAGFPTYIKYSVDFDKIDELIINGAECEPFITSDTRTMIDRSDDIAIALEYFIKYFGVKKIIIAIEKNKPEAIESMQKLAEKSDVICVKALPSVYPQGGEKVLIYNLTKKVVPAGKLPLDVGCIVSNCTTIADIGKYIKTGMPLVEKCVTVDGSAVKQPLNAIVPIGTALYDVFAFAGGYKSEPAKIIYGGPMMGISVPSDSVPVIKNTNAVLAFDKKDAMLKKPQPCIKCGNCINSCPFGINPPALARALDENDIDAMKKFGAEVCMECGSCSFVCPAHRPLVQNHRLIKAKLREKANKTTGGKK